LKIKNLFEKSNGQILEIRKKKLFKKSNGQILEIKKRILEIKQTNFGNQKHSRNQMDTFWKSKHSHLENPK